MPEMALHSVHIGRPLSWNHLISTEVERLLPEDSQGAIDVMCTE